MNEAQAATNGVKLLMQTPLWTIVRCFRLAALALDLRMPYDVPYVPGPAGVTYNTLPCDCGERDCEQ